MIIKNKNDSENTNDNNNNKNKNISRHTTESNSELASITSRAARRQTARPQPPRESQKGVSQNEEEDSTTSTTATANLLQEPQQPQQQQQRVTPTVLPASSPSSSLQQQQQHGGASSSLFRPRSATGLLLPNYHHHPSDYRRSPVSPSSLSSFCSFLGSSGSGLTTATAADIEKRQRHFERKWNAIFHLHEEHYLQGRMDLVATEARERDELLDARTGEHEVATRQELQRRWFEWRHVYAPALEGLCEEEAMYRDELEDDELDALEILFFGFSNRGACRSPLMEAHLEQSDALRVVGRSGASASPNSSMMSTPRTTTLATTKAATLCHTAAEEKEGQGPTATVGVLAANRSGGDAPQDDGGDKRDASPSPQPQRPPVLPPSSSSSLKKKKNKENQHQHASARDVNNKSNHHHDHNHHSSAHDTSTTTQPRMQNVARGHSPDAVPLEVVTPPPAAALEVDSSPPRSTLSMTQTPPTEDLFFSPEAVGEGGKESHSLVDNDAPAEEPGKETNASSPPTETMAPMQEEPPALPPVLTEGGAGVTGERKGLQQPDEKRGDGENVTVEGTAVRVTEESVGAATTTITSSFSVSLSGPAEGVGVAPESASKKEVESHNETPLVVVSTSLENGTKASNAATEEPQPNEGSPKEDPKATAAITLDVSAPTLTVAADTSVCSSTSLLPSAPDNGQQNANEAMMTMMRTAQERRCDDQAATSPSQEEGENPSTLPLLPLPSLSQNERLANPNAEESFSLTHKKKMPSTDDGEPSSAQPPQQQPKPKKASLEVMKIPQGPREATCPCAIM